MIVNDNACAIVQESQQSHVMLTDPVTVCTRQ